MKKSLIALAALASVAGVAQAQSTATIYGLLDLGYSSAEYKRDGVSQVKRDGFALSSDNTSRWGITGMEDIGGGLKASFKIESNIGTNPRSGIANDKASVNGTPAGNAYTLDSTVLGDRELWVAVEQGAARLQAGFGVTALRNLAVQTSADGTNNMGNPINHVLGAYRREGAQFSYAYGPVTATAMVTGNKQTLAGSESVPGDIKVGKGYNLGLVYNAGPALLGYARDVVDAQTPAFAAGATCTTTATGSGAPSAATYTTTCAALTGPSSTFLLPAVSAANTKTTTDLIAGSYDLGVVKGYAQWYKLDVNNKLVADGTGAGAGKIDGFSVGLTAPVGKFVVGGQVFDAKNKQYVTAGTAENRNYKGYTLRAAYNLSKRTYAYAATGEYKTDKGVASNAYETKYQQTSVGVVHAF